MLTNAGGRAGDALVLTKPLGAGTVATALKRGLASPDLVARAIEVMTTLNAVAAEQARAAGAHALTDVTGFGLLGHVHELALASGLAAEIDAAAVPAIEGVLDLERRARPRRRLAPQPRRRRHLHHWGDVPDPLRRLRLRRDDLRRPARRAPDGRGDRRLARRPPNPRHARLHKRHLNRDCPALGVGQAAKRAAGRETGAHAVCENVKRDSPHLGGV